MVSQHALRASEHIQNTRRQQAVEHRRPLLSVVNNSGIEQHIEMIGYGGDIKRDDFCQFAHRAFAIAQSIHDEQPRLIGEGFVDSRLAFEIFLRFFRRATFHGGIILQFGKIVKDKNISRTGWGGNL